MGHVVSFINMKGGVGKTTSSVTLAETYADQYGARVLLIDLDAQASASCALLGDALFEKTVDEELTLATYFDRIADGREPVEMKRFVTCPANDDLLASPIDVICAEPSLRYTERALIERYYKLRMNRVVTASAPEGQTRRVMRDQLQKLRSAYDLIVIDCPPGISIFAEAGVACSDLIVMPTIPDYLSTLGLRELNRKFLRQLRRDGNLSGRTAILPTKVQGNNLAHQQYLERLEALVRSGEIDATLFGCVISYSQTIARALDSQHLGESFKTKYRAATTDLTQFAEEVKGLLDDTPAAGQSPDAAHNAA